MIWEKKLASPAIYGNRSSKRLIILKTAIALMQASLPAFAANDGLGERWYISGITGQSRLQPKTSNTPFSLGDNSDLALGFSLGYDLNRWLSLEGHATDLGEASINLGSSKAGKISYSSAGGSLLAYLPLKSSQAIGKYQLGQREGFSLITRIGIGLLDTFTELPNHQNQNLHIFVGAGIEYGWENGLAVRVEGASYDQDARILGLGFVKRFGQIVKSTGLPILENPLEKPSVNDNASQTHKPIATPKLPSKNKPAKPRGAFFVLNLPIISFERKNSQLSISDEDKPALQKLAKVLRQKKRLRLSVEHFRPAQKTSDPENTAAIVIQFLLSHKVDPDQLIEAPPKTANPTSLLPNNRVEFSLAAQNQH